MRSVGKSFQGVPALRGIDLRVRPGECVALCGENGAGKSTLMKILSGVFPFGTWRGQILWNGAELRPRSIRETEAAGIVIIHQELMLVPHLTVAENIFLGSEPRLRFGLIDYDRMHARAAELMASLEQRDLNVKQPVASYAGGKQQLIEIAKALRKQAKLLILDEPTSSLTAAETRVLLAQLKALKAQGIALLYISHKLEEVAEIANSVTVLRDGAHVASAPMSELTTGKIIQLMVGRALSEHTARDRRPLGDVVLEARHVHCWDPVEPRRKVVDDVSLQLRRGEILGIAGLVGAGRTELVSALYGSFPGKTSLELHLDGKRQHIDSPLRAVRAGLCIVPEDRKRHGIVPLLGVGKNITLSVLPRFAHGGLLDSALEHETVKQQLAELSIRTAHPELPIASLSGGNQQKCVLAKMLLPMPRVLILDEPTRGVDVGAKHEIHKLIFALATRGPGILVVSSDLQEILGLCDRVLVMREGRVCGDFPNQNLTQEMVLGAALTPANAGE